jgi:uncharacterized membrane protein
MSDDEPILPHPQPQTRFRNTLLAGLLILAPLYLTIYVLVVLFRFMDGIFGPWVDRTLAALLHRPHIHVPGVGVLLTLSVILFLGWLSNKMVGQRIFARLEALIRRIPIAKWVYGATKGVLGAVSHEHAHAFKKVVLIEYPRRGMYGIGFVTAAGARWPGTGLEDPAGEGGELIPVFVPHTPNPFSGYLLFVPLHKVVDCALTVEEGVRMIVSGGILQPEILSRHQLRRQPARAGEEISAGVAGAAGAEP